MWLSLGIPLLKPETLLAQASCSAPWPGAMGSQCLRLTPGHVLTSGEAIQALVMAPAGASS